MNPPVSPQEVLVARTELPRLSLDVANDLFRSTWQASHVRFVELVPNSSSSLALLLAHVLTRNPAGGLPIEQWLPNVAFQPCTAESLSQLIAHAISDMEQEDRWPNETLAAALACLPIADVDFIFSVEAGAERRRPCSPYKYGPTHQVFWGKSVRLYCLEVHNES